MKIQHYLLLALLTQGTLQAQTVLFDDFEDGIVNPLLWSVDLPLPGSQISESGGLLTTTGRGTLATAGGLSGEFVVSGLVTLNHVYENFNVLLRSDLSQFNGYWERMGISVAFNNAYDVNLWGAPGISIAQHTPSGGATLATSDFTLDYGQPYDFSIVDTGARVAVAINGVERASAATVYAAGDRIAFFSREFSGTSSSLDYLSITVVPEPGTLTLAALGILALVAKAALQRRRAGP